jgi:hypothetical protein
MDSRFCPICNQVCVEGEEFDTLFCEKCGGALTPEGFLLRYRSPQVEEVGKGADVIWEYPEAGQGKVELLVRKITELESSCQGAERTSVTPISLGGMRWNLKQAIRRLRRWMIENENTPLVITDNNLRECARRVLRKEWKETEIDEDLWWTTDWLTNEFASGKNGHLDKVINYERTKLLELPVVLRHLPEAAQKALSEAVEASRWGLPSATLALCRLVLEDGVNVAWEAWKQSLGVSLIPPPPRQLRKLIKELPEELLPQKDKSTTNALIAHGPSRTSTTKV